MAKSGFSAEIQTWVFITASTLLAPEPPEAQHSQHVSLHSGNGHHAKTAALEIALQ